MSEVLPQVRNFRVARQNEAARDSGAMCKVWARNDVSLVQIRPLQSIVLSCERVPGTLQPFEFLGEFVQADGWARLPVTPLNPGSGKLRRTF